MSELTYADLYPGRFLRAIDLKGKAITVTIANVYMEEMEDKKGKKKKPIVSFVGKKLEMVLVKTNGECLKAMFGEVVKNWVGKRITLYPVMVDAFGEMKLAIRILGSPDLTDDLAAKLDLGQKSSRVKLRKTKGSKVSAPPPPEPEPEIEEGELDGESDTGEVPMTNEEKAEIAAAELGAAT